MTNVFTIDTTKQKRYNELDIVFYQDVLYTFLIILYTFKKAMSIVFENNFTELFFKGVKHYEQ